MANRGVKVNVSEKSRAFDRLEWDIPRETPLERMERREREDLARRMAKMMELWPKGDTLMRSALSSY